MNMTINQAAAIFNEVAAQATGRKDLAAVDATNFVSVAETVLKTGTDPIMGAISQVLTKTIFSIRPYYRKFAKLRETSEAYGNHVRKLTVCDQNGVDNSAYLVASDDPAPTPQWTYRKNQVLQTNYYGQDTYSDYISIDVMQLNTAFTSLESFRQYISMLIQNFSDRIEQRMEAAARLALCNFIAAKYVADTGNVYNLLSEYYVATGKYLTEETYADPSNYPDFCKWAAGFIQTISDRFTERTVANHMNVTIDGVAFNIPRHTPKSEQHLYLYAPEINQVQTRVLSDTFNQEYIKNIGDFEKVNYWQSYLSPTDVYVKAEYIDAAGESKAADEAVRVYNVFGILFDTEAIGIANVYEDMRTTPIEASQLFYNQWYHLNQSYRNDLTENAALFLIHQDLPDPSYMHVSPATLSIAPGATGEITVSYPQGAVTATSSATAGGITAAYSNGKVTVTVAADATADSATITITDGTTTETVAVTVAESKSVTKKSSAK